MIALDWTVVVQLVNFLILLFLLNLVLFRPIRRVIDEREDTVTTAEQRAEQAVADIERLRQSTQHRLIEARKEVYDHRQGAREQALEQAGTILGEARTHAENAVAEARVQIRSEVDAARPRMAKSARELAEDITQKLLQPLAS